MTNRITYYESLTEVRDRIIDGPDYGSDNHAGRASMRSADRKWSGGHSLQDCANMLLHGWQDEKMDFHQEVEKLLDQLSERMNDFIQDQHRLVLDVSGGFVDIDRYVLGEPENMFESWIEPDVTQGKALKVALNVAASAGVNPEYIKRRGLAVAAAVHAVNTMGFNVELWVGQTVRGGSDSNTEMVKAKDYFDPLDDEVTLMLCAHPGMLRRIIFWLEEQHEEKWRRNIGFGPEGGGYGSPSNFPEEVREQFDLVIERGTSFTASEIVDQLVVTSEEERLNEYR